MRKIIRKSFQSKGENIHLELENEKIIAKIVYIPGSFNEFLYTLVISYKETEKVEKHILGCFNMVKAKYLLGEIIIKEDSIKVVPIKRRTLVYNLDESDIREYCYLL
ncbi:MAG: hypothetical protein RR645_05645 [Clostridium sp.]